MTACNAVTPQALEYGGEYALELLIVLRILMGLGAGPSFPTLNVLLAAWVPEKERGRLGSFILGGAQVGTFLSGLILSYWPWPVVFYFWSIIGIIWFIAFTLLCFSDPASHPFITKEECNYLKSEIGQLERDNDLPPTPWIDILTSVPIIVLIISCIGSDWFSYVFLSDLPKYMNDVLGFSTHDVGFYSALPAIPMWITSVLSGFLCDYLISRRHVTILQARKLFSTLSGICPAIFLVAASYAGCNRVMVVMCLLIANGFLGSYYPGILVNPLDLSPNYAGTIFAIANGAGSLAGIIVPTFIGIMTPDSTLEQWRFVFWVTFCIAATRNIIYMIWASAEVQPWNDPKNRTESDKNCKI